MAVFTKPDKINIVWASAGDKIYPGDAKALLGWEVEIPPRQFFNSLDNKQDQFIAHSNQYGIPLWDAETEYQGGFSLAMGSDGIIYRCKSTHVNQVPSEASTYWSVTTLDADSLVALRRYVGYFTRSADFVAEVNTRYYATGPLNMTLPSSAVSGDVVTVAKSPNINITASVQTGTITTSIGSDTSIIFDISDELNIVFNGMDWEV